MLRFAFLLVPLAACYDGAGDRYATGQCPDGETCSSETPDGLQFIGTQLSDVLLESGPHTTALGGQQRIELVGVPSTGFVPDDEGGPALVVDDSDADSVTVTAIGSGNNYLRIFDHDGLLMDRKELAAAPLDRITLAPLLAESIPAGRDVAFFAGPRQLVVALFAGSDRVVDDRMTLDLAGATRQAWDALDVDLTAGTHTLTVTAGDKPAATLDIVAVDHVGSVQLLADQPTVITPNYAVSVCFEALTDGRYVAEVPWQFSIEGDIVGSSNTLLPNCIAFETTRTSGTIAVAATAAGASATTSLTIVSGATQLRTPPARPASITTAGDRAAM